jgi:hypothetical protein
LADEIEVVHINQWKGWRIGRIDSHRSQHAKRPTRSGIRLLYDQSYRPSLQIRKFEVRLGTTGSEVKESSSKGPLCHDVKPFTCDSIVFWVQLEFRIVKNIDPSIDAPSNNNKSLAVNRVVKCLGLEANVDTVRILFEVNEEEALHRVCFEMKR